MQGGHAYGEASVLVPSTLTGTLPGGTCSSLGRNTACVLCYPSVMRIFSERSPRGPASPLPPFSGTLGEARVEEATLSVLWPQKRRNSLQGELTFPLIASLGLQLIVKEISKLSYQSVSQLFLQLLMLAGGQGQPSPPRCPQPEGGPCLPCPRLSDTLSSVWE